MKFQKSAIFRVNWNHQICILEINNGHVTSRSDWCTNIFQSFHLEMIVLNKLVEIFQIEYHVITTILFRSWENCANKITGVNRLTLNNGTLGKQFSNMFISCFSLSLQKFDRVWQWSLVSNVHQRNIQPSDNVKNIWVWSQSFPLI